MEYISLGLTIAFAVFLGLGFLLGFKRGLKRTLVRSVWILAILFAVVFLSATLTSRLFDIQFNITIDGHAFSTLRAGIIFLFEENLPVSGVDYVAIVDLVIVIAGMILNTIIFLVAYWVLKFITVIPYWIGNIFIFAGERRRKRRARKEKQKYKVKKYRLAGALTGCLLAFVSFCITMTPIVGYISIAKDVENRTKSESGNGLIVETIGDTYSQFITAYDSSVPVKVMNTIGMDNILTLLFDGMTSTKINDTNIVLSEELGELSDVYFIAKDLNIPDFNNATPKEVNDFLDVTDEAVDAIFESKLISASVDTIIPFSAKCARNMINTEEFQPHVVEFMDAFFNQFEGFNALTTRQEIKGALNVIRILNNRNLLLPIVQNNTGDTAEFLKLNLTKDAVDEVMESVFTLKTVDGLAPAMVNFLLGEGSVRYGYEYSSENEILSATLKSCATTILYSAIDILNMYDASSTTKVDINRITVGAFGNILDELKIIVSTNNFVSIVNSIEPELKDLGMQVLGEAAPQFLKDALSGVVDNISDISGFNGAFISLYDAYEVAKAEFDNAYVEMEDKYDVELMDFVKLGKSLNTFQNSELVGTTLFLDTMKGAITYFIEEAEKLIAEDNSFKFTFDDVVVHNIEMLKGTGLDWSVELPVYKTTTGIMANLLQGEGKMIDKLRSDSDTTIERLGYELEHHLKTSNLFRNSDRLFVADFLDVADIQINTSDDETLSESLSTLLMDAKENVLTEAELNWEIESKHLKTIIQVEFDDTSDESILNIANTIDSIVFDTVEDDEIVLTASVIFKQDMINNFIVDYIDVIFGDVEETDGLYTTIQQMKTSFENETINSYTYEFDAMLELKSIEEIISEDGFDLKTSGTSIGARIDDALAIGVEAEVDPKVVVDKALINTLIVSEIDSLMSGYSDLDKEITEIKNGFNDDVQLYEVEFTALARLMEIADGETDFDNKDNARVLGAKIDIALTKVNVDSVDYNSTIITRNLINGYIKRIINDEVNLGVDSEFAEVIETITGAKNPDGTFNTGRIDTFNNTYENEFGYLSQLITISNNFADITVDNINEKNNTTNTTIAEEFDGSALVVDPLKNSYLVGDSLLLAIDSTIDAFIDDEENQKYNKILSEVDNNYAATKSQINWVLNSSGTMSYTEIIDALDEINSAINDGALTRTIQDVNHISTMAESYDDALNTLQQNILLSINGANEFAQYAMTQVADKLSEQGSTFAIVLEYINNYVDYLKYAKLNREEQPYVTNENIDVYKVGGEYTNTQPVSGSYITIRISNPFKYVGSVIDAINN